MELQEIKRACHTRKGSLHESGGSKKKTNTEFSYVLACINIWVFGKSIGDNGMGYLAAAVLVFALFWVLTGKNLPDRMGRMLRGRNARGQYRNVSRMRKNMMLFQIAEGLLGTVLCMSLGWILLEKVFLVPYGSMILWILSPALFFVVSSRYFRIFSE